MTGFAHGRGLLEAAVQYTLSISHHVSTEQLGGSTPCAGWDLRMLLDHLSESAGALSQGLTTGVVDLRPGPAANPDSALAASLRSGCERLLAACAYAVAPRRIAIADRDLTATVLASAGAIEMAVHSWDVAAAGGGIEPIPAALATALLQVAPLLLPPGSRDGRFAAPIPAPARSSPGERLVAYLGRNPRWQPNRT